MKTLTFILLLIISCSQDKQLKYGKVVISPQHMYEAENTYFPHDHFIESELGELLEKSVEIKTANDKTEIINHYNDGYSGHKVRFIINSKLEIEVVEYDEWSDIEYGSESKYTVEQVILTLNSKPTFDSRLIGHYTLKIREDFNPGKLLKNEGVEPNLSYRTFNGKFKIYSEEEKRKGLEWVNQQTLESF